MSDTHPPSSSLTRRIDEVCNRFEEAWRSGSRPRVEDFLDGWEGTERLALLRQLVPLEWDYRRVAGEDCAPEEYRARFSEFDPAWLAEAVPSTIAPSDSSLRSHAGSSTWTAGLTPSAAPAGLPCIGGYELLHEIGRGGMAVVYKARQAGLDRLVALKMPLRGDRDDQERRVRFYSEARKHAGLSHPNIVRIHQVGLEDGWPYFSMEFVEGGSLEKKLAGTPLPADEAARLVESLARAMHFAHGRKIIHRDLKPANVLLASGGREPAGAESPPAGSRPPLAGCVPMISDFGLARRLDVPGRTQEGAVLGTPSYMAPEQARGELQAIGPWTDVYALGAILYECLTGRPPFKGSSSLETVLQVLEDEPVSPSRLQRRVPRDLETICLKCLEKEPQRRYPDARELADDLRRWLSGEPTRARPVGLPGRAVKWARRRPAVAGLLGLVGLVTAVGLALVTWKWREAVAEGLRADDARRDAVQKAADEEQARLAADRARTAAEEALDEAATALYRQRLNEGRNVLPVDAARARTLLYRGPLFPRAFEWHYLLRQTDHSLLTLPGHHPGIVTCVAFDPGGRRLASGSLSGALRVWDLAAGEMLAEVPGNPGDVSGRIVAVAFAGDGQQVIAVAANGTVRRFAAATGTAAGGFRLEGELAGAALDSGRRRLACLGRDGIVSMWDTASGKQLFALPRDATRMDCVAFSHDGRLVTAGALHAVTVQTWDPDTGKEAGPPLTGPPHERFAVRGVAVSPGGTHVAAAGGEGKVRVWDLRTGKLVETLVAHDAAVAVVAYSPDGQRLATAGQDSTVRVHDARGFGTLFTLKGHSDTLHALAFSPDGRRLVSGGSDGSLRLWDPTASPGPRTLPFVMSGRCSGVAFTPDSRWAATGGEDGTLCLWEVASGKRGRTLSGSGERVACLAFHPGADRLASADVKGGVMVWDLAGGKPVTLQPPGQWLGEREHVFALAFSADGRWLVRAANEGTVTRWDLNAPHVKSTFRSPHTVPVHGAEARPTVAGVALSGDGRRFASGGQDGQVCVWDTHRGAILRRLTVEAASVLALAFSPDGQRLVAALGGKDGPTAVRVWELAEGRAMLTFDTRGGEIRHLALGPKRSHGQRLATLDVQGTVRVWDLGGPHGRAASVEELLRLRAPDRSVGLAFSPDGHRLAAAGAEGLRIWDGPPGQEVFVFGKYPQAVHALAYTRQGERLITAGAYTVHVWDWAQGRAPFAQPSFPEGSTRVDQGALDPSYCWDAALSPDGRHFATARGNAEKGEVKVYEAASERALRTLTGHRGMVKAVAYGRDGRLFSAGWDGMVCVWGPEGDGEPIRWTVDDAGVNGLAVSPDGASFATAGRRGGVRLWNAATGERLLTLAGHAGRGTRVAFSPDGKWLASAGGSDAGGEVKVWDAKTGACLRTFRHRRTVFGVAFSPDGQRLGTGGDDGLLRIWDIERGREVLVLRGHLDAINRVLFSPDGRHVASASEDQTVRIWSVVRGQ